MDSMYESDAYLQQNPEYHVADSPWKATQIVSLIGEHRLSPSTVCEIGCGAGEILRQLQSSLPPDTRFVGYDISPHAISLCRQRENERLRFYCEDLLQAPDGVRYDLLLCIDVFEHVEDYLGFLRAMRERANRVIFHIPLDLSAQMVLRSGPILRVRRKLGHLHYFTKETALETLRYAGYEILDWRYTAGGVDRAASWRARILKFPRLLSFRIHRDLTVRVLGGFSLLVLAQ